MKDKKLKNRVSSLEKDMEMLKGILKSLGLNNSQDNSKELDELKSQLSKKESEVDNLKNILSNKDDEIKSLNYTISQQTIEIGTLKDDYLKLSEELNQNPLKELEIVFNSLDDKTKNGIENINTKNIKAPNQKNKSSLSASYLLITPDTTATISAKIILIAMRKPLSSSLDHQVLA